MVKSLTISGIGIAIVPFLLMAQPILKPTVTQADQAFLRHAAEINLSEVVLGQLAQEKSSAEPVKDYAQRMITDHTKSQEKLKVVAARTNVILPDQATAKNTATYGRLAKLSGPDFDRAYMNEMVQGHTQAVALFKSKAKAAPDAGVRMFAQSTLPILEEHLKLAHQTAVQIGATSRR